MGTLRVHRTQGKYLGDACAELFIEHQYAYHGVAMGLVEFPTGTVTFLFTDIEASTRLWEQHPDAARQALVRHDALSEALVA
jgi:class 3 adenylate cyclase